MRTIYLVAAIVGAVGPYVFFAQFLTGPDTSLGAFTAQLFATPPAAGFTTDLLITSFPEVMRRSWTVTSCGNSWLCFR